MLNRKIKTEINNHADNFKNAKEWKSHTKKISKNSLRAYCKEKLKIIGKSRKHRQQDKNIIERQELQKIFNPSKCQCPICLQLVICPVILDCGHIYCMQCFQESSVYSLLCCLCRQQQTTMSPRPSTMVESLIKQLILPTYSQDINYWCRQGHHKNWELKRRVELKQTRVGDFVDVRDELYVWRVGMVKRIYYQQQEFYLSVKIRRQEEFAMVEVPLESRRLAKPGFFTKAIYLKERTSDYIKNFVQGIQIPQIQCQFQQNFTKFSQTPQNQRQNDIEIQEQSRELALQLFDYEMNFSSQFMQFL